MHNDSIHTIVAFVYFFYISCVFYDSVLHNDQLCFRPISLGGGWAIFPPEKYFGRTRKTAHLTWSNSMLSTSWSLLISKKAGFHALNLAGWNEISAARNEKKIILFVLNKKWNSFHSARWSAWNPFFYQFFSFKV